MGKVKPSLSLAASTHSHSRQSYSYSRWSQQSIYTLAVEFGMSIPALLRLFYKGTRLGLPKRLTA